MLAAEASNQDLSPRNCSCITPSPPKVPRPLYGVSINTVNESTFSNAHLSFSKNDPFKFVYLSTCLSWSYLTTVALAPEISPVNFKPVFKFPVGVVINIGNVEVGLATASELNLLPWFSMFKLSIAPIVSEYTNSFAPLPVATLLLTMMVVARDVPPLTSFVFTNTPVCVLSLRTVILFKDTSISKILAVAVVLPLSICCNCSPTTNPATDLAKICPPGYALGRVW